MDVEELVLRRQKTFAYLRRVHAAEPGVLWLNSVRLQSALIECSVAPGRAAELLVLGSSIARFLGASSSSGALRCLAQVLDEWEYCYASTAVKSLRYVTAKPVDLSYYTETDQVKPSLRKVAGVIVYELLLVPQLPSRLSYCETVIALLDVLSVLYNKLLDVDTPALLEAIPRLDQRLRQMVTAPIVQHLTQVADPLFRGELREMSTGIAGPALEPLDHPLEGVAARPQPPRPQLPPPSFPGANDIGATSSPTRTDDQVGESRTSRAEATGGS